MSEVWNLFRAYLNRANIGNPNLSHGRFHFSLPGCAESHILSCFVFLFLLVFYIDVYFKEHRGAIFKQPYSFSQAVNICLPVMGRLQHFPFRFRKLVCSSHFCIILKNKKAVCKQRINFVRFVFSATFTDRRLTDIFPPLIYGIKRLT